MGNPLSLHVINVVVGDARVFSARNMINLPPFCIPPYIREGAERERALRSFASRLHLLPCALALLLSHSAAASPLSTCATAIKLHRTAMAGRRLLTKDVRVINIGKGPAMKPAKEKVAQIPRGSGCPPRIPAAY